MTTIFKEYTIKAKSVDTSERIVEGYASTWDEDQVADIIHPGAFQKSINERFSSGKVKMLWQHADPIGIPLEMREDDKGLWVKARISKTALGDEALELAKDGVVDQFSIGFSIPKGKAMIDDDGIRHIFEAKLMEFSLVTFAANEAAVLTAVKQMRRMIEEKGAEFDGRESGRNTEDDPGQDNGGGEKGSEDFDELKSMLEEFSTFAKHRLY